MGMIDPLVAEFTQEMATTRTMLEAVPEQHLAWKPHVKSMSLGRLASHIAEMPGFAGAIMGRDVLNLDASYQPQDFTA
jgi:uncharacterized damage-inducible protein DinB